MLSRGQVLQGRYRIEEVLGIGGMGSVYRAEHLLLERPVALKELRFDPASPSYASAVRGFRQEAQMLHDLRHPGLPRVYDLLEDEGSHYLVMDFVPGRTVADVLLVEESLDEDQVLDWAGQIGRALAYLHDRVPPVIFRDLKPSNVMLRPDGRIVLIDFGIAKVVDDLVGPMTRTSARGMLSPGFAAPEQYSGGTDRRSDVYSFGATLYCLLTRELPPDAVDRACGQGLLRPVRELRPEVSERTARAVESMLELERGRRPPDALTCLQLLGLEEGGDPPERLEAAAPPSPPVLAPAPGSRAGGPPLDPVTSRPFRPEVLPDDHPALAVSPPDDGRAIRSMLRAASEAPTDAIRGPSLALVGLATAIALALAWLVFAVAGGGRDGAPGSSPPQAALATAPSVSIQPPQTASPLPGASVAAAPPAPSASPERPPTRVSPSPSRPASRPPASPAASPAARPPASPAKVPGLGPAASYPTAVPRVPSAQAPPEPAVPSMGTPGPPAVQGPGAPADPSVGAPWPPQAGGPRPPGGAPLPSMRPQEGSLRIEPGRRVSVLALGVAARRLAQSQVEYESVVLDGEPAMAAPRLALAVKFRGGRVSRIMIMPLGGGAQAARMYATSGGVGWGSSAREVEAEFGPPLREAREGGAEDWVYPRRGISFRVEFDVVRRVDIFAPEG